MKAQTHVTPDKNSPARAYRTIKRMSVLALRRRVGYSQEDFWAAVSVSQSRGSRYERKATPIPAPVLRLLYAVYVLGAHIPGVTEA